MKVVFSYRALIHLDDLHRYISSQSYETRADAYIQRLDRYCQTLADFPERGSKRDDIMPNLRLIGFERNAMIAFTIEQDVVIIEAVLYAGRSVETLLEDPS